MQSVTLANNEILSTLNDELCKEHLPKEAAALAVDVMERVMELLKAPAYQPEEGAGFALSESGVVTFNGGVVREDGVYSVFPGEATKVRETLDRLHSLGFVAHRLFRPDPELDRWAARVFELFTKKKVLPLAPLAASRVLAGGDWRGGALLYQVRYWHGKAKVWRNGRLWIVKTGDEWQAETALSKNQYERGLRTLKVRGLVETEQHISKLYEQSVTFLRPLYYAALGNRLFEEDGFE